MTDDKERKLPPLFIEGRFHDRIVVGNIPEYHGVINSLPEIPEGTEMEMITGFIAGLPPSGEKNG